METRPYFILGDVSCSVTVGLASGTAVMALGSLEWSMPVSMVAGMLLGMTVAAIGIIAFGLCFGMMELHMPAMITGMLTGMGVVMLGLQEPLAEVTAGFLGALVGLVIYTLTWMADALLQRERS